MSSISPKVAYLVTEAIALLIWQVPLKDIPIAIIDPYMNRDRKNSGRVNRGGDRNINRGGDRTFNRGGNRTNPVNRGDVNINRNSIKKINLIAWIFNYYF